MKIFTRSRRDLAAISARSRRVFGRRDFPISPRSRHRAEITAEIAARSRRDTGNLGGQKLAAISPRFSPRYGKSRRPKTRRDLAAILAEIWEISAAKNAPRSRRNSRRDLGNLGGQKRAAISPRFSPRSQRDMEISAGKYAARCCSEIRKSRRPKRAEIARRYRGEIWKSRRAVSRRGLGGSCRGLRLETKFLAVKILLLSRREAKFSAAKIGSMRTIFTFTLTINQTTRR